MCLLNLTNNSQHLLSISDDTDNQHITYRRAEITNTVSGVSLNEANEIYLINRSLEIFNYDLSNCLTLIMLDGKEISVDRYYHEYAKYLTKNQQAIDTVFLKISDNQLKPSNNECLIYTGQKYYNNEIRHLCGYPISVNTLYDFKPIYTKQIDENISNITEYLENDLDGYNNTQKAIRRSNRKKYADYISESGTVNYCANLHISVGNDTYDGYVPSIGQLILLRKYNDLLDYILYDCLHQDLLGLYLGTWWSSTVIKQDKLCRQYALNDGEAKPRNTAIYGRVLPLFKKIS